MGLKCYYFSLGSWIIIGQLDLCAFCCKRHLPVHLSNVYFCLSVLGGKTPKNLHHNKCIVIVKTFGN